MKYLFVHQNFPGQYLHIVRHLVEDPANEVVFIAEPNQNAIPGTRRVYYQAPRTETKEAHPNARDYDMAARRAEAVASTATNLKRLGFRPDVIIGHHGWGELLNMPDVWSDVPILGYFEFYYRTDGQDVGFDAEFPTEATRFARIRAMNVVNLLALSLEQHGQTPTQWQLTRYPVWTHGQIKVLPEGAPLDRCAPDPSVRAEDLVIRDFRITPDEKLVTYVARNLEPYRGFHSMMRALPRLLAERSDVKVVIIGGDDVSYGARLANSTWREHFQKELSGKYDSARVMLPGQVPYETYLKLLKRSDCHVYLTYPFVASWSLREAMACGCAIVGSDVEPVAEFIEHERTGLLVNTLKPVEIADAILRVLEDQKLSARIRQRASKWAEQHLDMADYIAAFHARIGEITGINGRPASGKPKSRARKGDRS